MQLPLTIPSEIRCGTVFSGLGFVKSFLLVENLQAMNGNHGGHVEKKYRVFVKERRLHLTFFAVQPFLVAI